MMVYPIIKMKSNKKSFQVEDLLFNYIWFSFFQIKSNTKSTKPSFRVKDVLFNEFYF